MEQTKKPLLGPKRNLWVRFREWHIWLGVAMSLFIVAVCATGIYLNHEKFFKGEKPPMGGMETKGKMEGPSGLLTTSTDLKKQPVGFEKALASAKAAWGEIPIEHIHLNDDHGKLVYKIKAEEGREILVDAVTGKVTEKDGYQVQIHGDDMSPGSGLNWGKILKDIHTGKIAGGTGKLIVDFTSIVLIGLTLTGIYLWIVPKWKRRKAAQAAALQALAQGKG